MWHTGERKDDRGDTRAMNERYVQELYRMQREQTDDSRSRANYFTRGARIHWLYREAERVRTKVRGKGFAADKEERETRELRVALGGDPRGYLLSLLR